MVELGVPPQRLPHIIATAPNFLLLKTSRIQRTVDELDEMFGAGFGVKTLASNSVILNYNVDGMRRSFEYLVSVVGFTPERLAINAAYVARSVNNFLRRRFEFLEAKGVDVLGKVGWIMTPDRVFMKKYPDYEVPGIVQGASAEESKLRIVM